MDIESFGKDRGSKLSFSSGRESYLSLEALTDPRLSFKQKASLIDIMDLEVNRNSHRKSGTMMIEENEAALVARFSQQSGENYSFKPTIQEKDLNRKSNFKIKHECSCHGVEESCNGVHCICFLTPREICVIGQCCPKCIQSKNNFFRQTRGWQLNNEIDSKQTRSQYEILMALKQKNCKNMHYLKQIYSKDPYVQNLTFCTCKKSHCQKKYCLCYDRGVKCGEFCACIECNNTEKYEYEQDHVEQQQRWLRYATYEKQEPNSAQVQDIDQFMHYQLQGDKEFDQIMQFQPVNFDNVLSNNYQ